MTITLKDIRDDIRSALRENENQPLNRQQVDAVLTKLLNDIGEYEAEEAESC